MIARLAKSILDFIRWELPKTYPETEKMRREKDELMRATGLLREGDTNPDSFEEERLYDKKKLIGVAGVMKRHGVIPSYFLAIDPKHHGKGLGTELSKKFIRKWKGIVFMTVARDNIAAQKIYTKIGFRKVCDWRKIRDEPYEMWARV